MRITLLLRRQFRTIIDFWALSLDNLGVVGSLTTLVFLKVDHGLTLLKTTRRDHLFIVLPTLFSVVVATTEQNSASAESIAHHLRVCTRLTLILVVNQLAACSDGTDLKLKLLADVKPLRHDAAVVLLVLKLNCENDQYGSQQHSFHY